MKTNEHFWWTFFPEAAHILLHRGCHFAGEPDLSSSGLIEIARNFRRTFHLRR
jgi:HTH-type transcriptional regulator / antitoxin HigA